MCTTGGPPAPARLRTAAPSQRCTTPPPTPTPSPAPLSWCGPPPASPALCHALLLCQSSWPKTAGFLLQCCTECHFRLQTKTRPLRMAICCAAFERILKKSRSGACLQASFLHADLNTYVTVIEIDTCLLWHIRRTRVRGTSSTTTGRATTRGWPSTTTWA